MEEERIDSYRKTERRGNGERKNTESSNHRLTGSLTYPFNNSYCDKRVLVTGHTGFKGSWLTTWLLKLGAKVYGISKDIPTDPSMFLETGLKHRIKHYEEDLRSLDRIVSILGDIRPEFVFHLAAQSIVSRSYSEPIETISTNVLGTANILEALRCYNQRCCAVIITSDKCYDNVEWVWGYKETDPLGGKDIYSGSKGAAEMIIKSFYHSFFKKENSNIRIASARAGNVIGGGDWAPDRIVPDCIRAWVRGESVSIRNPRATRPWQHVLEPLSGYLALGRHMDENASLSGESFNFGPLAQESRDVCTLIEELRENFVTNAASISYEITEQQNFHEAGLLKLNCDKALFFLEWVPSFTYSELIQQTSQWYAEFYKGKSDMFDVTVSQINEYEAAARERCASWSE